MDRNQILRAGGSKHRPDLLGIRVIADPGIVGADRESGDFRRIPRQWREEIGRGGITRDQYPMPVAGKNVAVEAVGAAERRPALAPMARSRGGDYDTVNHSVLSPAKLAHVGEP